MSTQPSPPTADTSTGGVASLEITNVEVIYDDVVLVLRGLSLRVERGRIAALLGPNGAGKSTTLKAVTGLLRAERGEVTEGSIHFAGQDVTRMDPAERVRRGMSLCMEGRHVFEHLTVAENLVAGAYTSKRTEFRESLDLVHTVFPRLTELRWRTAGYLSGGEQQMLAIGRALMAQPTLLLLDEPSLGLAPLLVQEIFDCVKSLNTELGTTILLVEQNARRALEIADHGFIMERGKIVLDGPADELRQNPDVREFYLGIGEQGNQKSFREVKRYKRRKRWL
jgi:branched-chain amino acid transport system ATP-binding protein